jgi:hypothetical protein
MKGTIHQEKITMVNTYVPNIGHATSLNKHYYRDPNMIIVEEFNTPDRSSRQNNQQKNIIIKLHYRPS